MHTIDIYVCVNAIKQHYITSYLQNKNINCVGFDVCDVSTYHLCFRHMYLQARNLLSLHTLEVGVVLRMLIKSLNESRTAWQG